jgi:hypothetical protein
MNAGTHEHMTRVDIISRQQALRGDDILSIAGVFLDQRSEARESGLEQNRKLQKEFS